MQTCASISRELRHIVVYEDDKDKFSLGKDKSNSADYFVYLATKPVTNVAPQPTQTLK